LPTSSRAGFWQLANRSLHQVGTGPAGPPGMATVYEVGRPVGWLV